MYQVLARKYRPRTFDEVVGQDAVIRTLKNAISTGRIAHAFLFVGPRGIGKTSTARILAKALNCPGGPKVDFDPDEEICVEIAEGRSLDVIEIDGASNNSVENIRDLRENVKYAPTQGKFKIYIIDEVHMLSASAFNALLKTLEEPPAHVKFIFATTEVHKVLPTILSRCQRFDLRRISETDIVRHLEKICKLEKVNVSTSALQLIARQAEGGMRDAESALDQLISFCGTKIEEKDVLQMYALTSGQEVRDLAEAILEGRNKDALEQARAMSHAGKDTMRLSQDLLRHFRNMLLFQISPEVAKEELTDAEQEYLSKQKNPPSRPLLMGIVEELIQLEGKLRFALVKEAVFEIALMRLSEQREKISLEEVLKSLAGTGRISPSSENIAKNPHNPGTSHIPNPMSTTQQPPPPKPQSPEENRIAAKAASAQISKLSQTEFENDPLVIEAIKQFEAKIVEIRK